MRGARSPWLFPLAAVAAVAGVSVLYQGTRPGAIVDTRPRDPQIVSFLRGSFRGVSLGERTAAVVRTLGRPARRGTFPSPTRASADAQLPTGPGDAISLDYTDVAVDTKAGRVIWIVTTSASPQTRLGIGVGDSLALARRAYHRLRCTDHSTPSDPPSGPPACFERTRSGVSIEIIGDPITTIAVHGVRPLSTA